MFSSQFNTAARQLIELDKPSDSNGDSGEGASSGPLSNGAQRVGEKKNSKKRHSFTSLTMSHKPMLAPPPQRHSMEISGPVLISSSNPTAAARIGEISGGLSCSAPSQVKSERELEQHMYPNLFSNRKLYRKQQICTFLGFFLHASSIHASVFCAQRFVMDEKKKIYPNNYAPIVIFGSCSYASTGIIITAKSSIPVLLYNVDDIRCYLP